MAVDRVRLTRTLMAIVVDTPAATELPNQICRACVNALPVDGVGVSLIASAQLGGRVLLGASDVAGMQIEELQFDLGEGPCLSAFSRSQPVLVPDVQADEAHARWPMFSRAVAGLGLGAVFAFPLHIGAVRLGALDCHRIRAGPLAEITEALTVADALTMALLSYQAHAAEGFAGHEVDLFDMSWRNHAEVHQATGWLAARLDISTTDALARLRAYAFRHSRTLHNVATDIIAGTLRLPELED